MTTYHITITETLKKVVEVQGNDIDEALLRAKAMYTQEDVVLTADDFDGATFTADSDEYFKERTGARRQMV